MSNIVSALDHATYAGITDIREMGLNGMITLRGDLSAAKIKSAAKSAAGLDIPPQGHINTGKDGSIAWMSPDEVLVMCAYDSVPDTLAKMHKSLAKTHALAVNVSDARALFEVHGPHAREVMAKLCPVDLSPASFAPGMFRRTRMAQVPAAFWMPQEDTFRIICFRSVAEYAFGILKMAAQKGSEVGYFDTAK
ncbi:Sarcosine oxidase subunit gamma (plasmid) [Pseudoseohaeicola sp. NH-UV-7]|uniref:sarcosine oxidase subunit gamma n=1 Tax=unclassified Sulfitobacter TaxID=196795 RepID=UPI000E0A2F6C|nr:sarcosine oxidase subunit gamma family protein [Sulfitobacter sp. JL08]AXI54498.1 sarcosine oxidase subunit gamma [Sulfitobacter sp. JL08]